MMVLDCCGRSTFLALTVGERFGLENRAIKKPRDMRGFFFIRLLLFGFLFFFWRKSNV